MNNKKNALLQLFSKPPIEGRVKSRLAIDIGDTQATEIYRHCLSHSMDLVTQSGLDYQLWLSENSQDPIFRGNPLMLQQGHNLGARMYHAISSQLQDQAIDKVILIGSDCLDLSLDHLQQALDRLATNDLVLLPSVDGGYVLIGCRKIDQQLFSDVEWGSDRVLQQTQNNAAALSYRLSLLAAVRDIDTLKDVNHYTELTHIISKDSCCTR